jgi:hypothetical protein
MGTFRRTGNLPTSVYTGQQKPYATQQTQQSIRTQPPQLPARYISTGHVIDNRGWPISMEPVRLGSEVPGTSIMTAVHLSTSGDIICVGTENGVIYESVDGGMTWAVGYDLEDTACRINAFCDYQNNTVYACCHGGSGYGRLLYRDTNGDWSVVHTSGEKNIVGVAVKSLSGTIVIVTTDGTNNGKIWSGTSSFTLRTTAADKGMLGPVCVPYNQDARFVVVARGDNDLHAYYSSDGNSWTQGASIPYSPVYSVSVLAPAGWLDWISGKSLVAVVRVASGSADFHFYVYDIAANTWTQEYFDFPGISNPISPVLCLFKHKGAAYLSLLNTDAQSDPTGENVVLKRVPAYNGTKYVGTWVHYWDGPMMWSLAAANNSLGVISGIYTPEIRLFVPYHPADGHRHVYASSQRQLIY